MKTGTNISREKARKSLFNSESAGATVIAAVLLLSIIFTVLVVVRTEYVPMWKNDAEQSHMSEVLKDMAELKSTADMVSLFTYYDSNASAYGFPVTVTFSMGGGEIPIADSSKSSGTLSLNTEQCRMTITPEKSSIIIDPQIVDCGGITYRSNNREYLDQVFRYENGALILSQKNRSLMRQFPSFDIISTDEDNYTVSIHVIKMTGNPDSISSNTDSSLRLTGLYAEPVYDSNDSEGIDSFTCTILTGYPDAWVSYINETAKTADLEYDTDYIVTKIGSDTVYFSCLGNGSKNLERLEVSKSVIQAELGDGISLDNEEVNESESEESESEESGSDESGSEEDESVMKLNQWYCFDTFTGTYNGITLSPSPEPALLEDYNQAYSLPSEVKNHVLSSYSEINDFDYYVGSNKILNLNFDFGDYDSFESNVTTATIRMIYRFEDNQEPNMQMTLAGTEMDSFKPNNNNWCLYNKTFTLSPDNPTDLTLNLKVISGASNVNGNFHIDYLAVRLN